MATSTDYQKPAVQSALNAYTQEESGSVEIDLQAEQNTRDRLFSIPAELYMHNSVTICSIWPEPLESQPFSHGGVGRKVYKIPAGSPEKPAYLTLFNTYAGVIEQEGDRAGTQMKPISAASYAFDIINHWTGDHPGNRKGKMGVGIIVGQTATPAEVKNLETVQHDFLAYMVERADEFWDRGKREKIGKGERRALKMLGLDEAQHPWFRSRIQQYNDCPNCAEKVFIDAIYCKHCRNSIVAYFTDRGEVPSAAAWPRVVKEISRLTETKPEVKTDATKSKL